MGLMMGNLMFCAVIAMSAVAAGQLLIPAFGDSSLGTLNFKQIIADDGKKYAIGEIQNNDPSNNIESGIYFDYAAKSHYENYVGIIGHGMAMPFKFELPADGPADMAGMRVDSHVTLSQPDDLLKVDYSTLHMDPSTHAIRGLLRNTSPVAAHFVAVYAIAMDAHAKVLDVTKSDVIYNIAPGGSAPFTLVPLPSVARDVSYYSCFVPGQSGQNYTFPAGDGTEMTFQISSDGEIRNVGYDPSTHSITFDVEGVFPQGGWAELIVLSQPYSHSKFQSLGVTLNNESARQSISSLMTISGSQYSQVSLLFPYGKNVVSIQPVSPAPEMPAPESIIVAAFLLAIAFSYKSSSKIPWGSGFFRIVLCLTERP